MRLKNIKLSLKQVFSIKLMYVSEAANDLAPLVWGHFHHLSDMDIRSQFGKYAEAVSLSWNHRAHIIMGGTYVFDMYKAYTRLACSGQVLTITGNNFCHFQEL